MPSMKILIADDEKALTKALTLKLTKSGFQVESVNDGEEVLRALESSDFDLLLLDLVMPKMNGFQVLEAIKNYNLYPNLSIIVMSNLSQEVDLEKVRSHGITEYIVKSNTTLADIVKIIETKV